MRQRLGSALRRLTGLLGLLGMLNMTLAGCGKAGDGGKLMPVAGKVTLNDQPLGTGSVTFHPDKAKGNHAPHMPVGMLDSQGNYKLMSATKEGAPPGWYKVTVTAQGPADAKNPYALPKHLINPKFSNVQTSHLEVEVVENPDPGRYDFKVTK